MGGLIGKAVEPMNEKKNDLRKQEESGYKIRGIRLRDCSEADLPFVQKGS